MGRYIKANLQHRCVESSLLLVRLCSKAFHISKRHGTQQNDTKYRKPPHRNCPVRAYSDPVGGLSRKKTERMQHNSSIVLGKQKQLCSHSFMLVSFMPKQACWTPILIRPVRSCSSAITAERPFKSEKKSLMSQSLAHHLSLFARPCQPSGPRYRIHTSYASCNFHGLYKQDKKRWTVSASEIFQRTAYFICSLAR